jgi:drug/metabolite transporter (DMT)-like permease
MNEPLKTKGILLTLISTIGFSTYPILGKFVFTGGANFATTLFFRFCLAAFIFWLIAFFYEGIPKLQSKVWITLILMGAIVYASMSGLYLASVNYIPASLAALILYTYPIIVAILSVATKQEALSKSKIIGLLISSAGLVLILGFNFKGINPLGVLLAFGAAVTYSVYIIIGNSVLKHVEIILSSAVIATSSAVTYGLIGVQTGFTWDLSYSTWLGLLGMSAFCSILAMLTFFKGLRAIGPTSASVISSLEPLMTFAFAAILFKERLTLLQGFGGILVILGGLSAVYTSKKLSTLPKTNTSKFNNLTP